jgi:arylsulfatase A-like enzyme/Tfp pilus assembly protein PilF
MARVSPTKRFAARSLRAEQHRPRWPKVGIALSLLAAALAACARDERGGVSRVPRSGGELPSLLLVTLDTTRADAVGWEGGAQTPELEALAARGVRFAHAYATAPMTLPSHASMLTGLYPSEHGIHENSRVVRADEALLAPRLRARGYRTAAFVSALPLSRRFGLAAGFDRYDDSFGDENERPAGETTAAALEHLASLAPGPTFLWVHYFDPHDPYQPPEPYRSRYPSDPYLGEVAYVDGELGKLLSAFERHAGGGPWRVLVAGDHGESRGEHGETFHGNLLYQGAVRVPLVIAGSGISGGAVVEAPVSARRVHDTLLGWAGADLGMESEFASLLEAPDQTVFAEAMKPFLEYGWQPQVMAVTAGLEKAIWSGELELYDLAADPAESRDLAGEVELDAGLIERLRSYPVPEGAAIGSGAASIDDETRARLAALGYTTSEGRPAPRADAPAPKEMTHLFDDLDRGSGLFLQHRYAEAVPLLERLAGADPDNLTVHLRLAVARSVLGREAAAAASFRRALELGPASVDVWHYLGLHHLRAGRPEEAERWLERARLAAPDRVPTLEALAEIRGRQGRLEDALSLLERARDLTGTPTASQLTLLGDLEMARGETARAREAFEALRALQGESFSRHLELGVLYLAERRLADARDSLDRVSPRHPAYGMALFKRAQVAALLGEPDLAERVRRAWREADAELRRLILDERLFAGVRVDATEP